MSPTCGFEGRAALVTGAGSAIGLAAARAFADAGASVTLAGVDEGRRLRASPTIVPGAASGSQLQAERSAVEKAGPTAVPSLADSGAASITAITAVAWAGETGAAPAPDSAAAMPA